MQDLDNVQLAWLEYDNHQRSVNIADRAGGVYRCKSGSFDPFSKTLRLVFPDIKELGFITSGWLYRYGKTVFPGMYRSEIKDRFNKLSPVGTGYRLSKADMSEFMHAYYKVGGERQWEPGVCFNGVPVPIVHAITGQNQIVVRDDLTVEASPDLRGKVVHVRVEFPMPEKSRQIPQHHLNAIIFYDEKFLRLRWCEYKPSKATGLSITLCNWVEQEKVNV